MQKIYKVYFMGRKRGAIGIFYLCDLNFIAESEAHASDMLFEDKHNPDYEVNNVVSIKRVTEK